MGKHENASDDAPQQPALGKKQKRKRRRVLPLILVAAITGILLLIIFILKPPDIGFIGDKKPNGDDDPVTQPTDPATPDDDAPEVTEPGLKEQFYTFLLAGTNDSYNTDTIILCSVDVKSGKINMVSVPRDSMVDRDIKYRKINNAYGRKGAEELCTEVTEVTGVPINYYCIINVDSFVEIVDLIGGVEYNVPVRMYHPDADSQYTIDLQKGMQMLDGDEAAQFCRYRSTSENDFGRMNRQKDFLMAALRQVREKFQLSQVEDFINVFNESVKTNMSVRDMAWFYINVLSKLDLDNDVATNTLPYTHTGKYMGEDYVYLDAAGIVELVNKTVNPYTTDISQDDLDIICLED